MMIEVFQEDFMRSLKARDFRKLSWIYKHSLRNAIDPNYHGDGINVGKFIGGCHIDPETIFHGQGMGRWLVKSVEARNYLFYKVEFYFYRWSLS